MSIDYKQRNKKQWETKRKNGTDTSWLKGKKLPYPIWNKGLKNPALSNRQRGENNPNWKGGVSSENEKFRKTTVYKNWRIAVFERDDYTCQACGNRGGKLHADHELPFAEFPDLRLEILNGRTLCVPCHIKTDSYGNRISPFVIKETTI